MKCFKKSMAVTLALSMILGTPGIPAGAAKKGAVAKVQSVSIEKPDTKTLVLKKNEKFQLKTKVLAKGGISKKVTFKSSDRKVVTVSKKGRLAAKKKGTAKITVASMAKPSKKAVLTVKVGIPVKKVNLSDAKLTGKAGESVKLKATVLPKDATVADVAFTSSNAKTAKVSSKGKVSFLKEGKADITVKAQDGSGKKAVCKVEVTGAEPTATPAEPTVTPTEPTVTPTEPTAEPPATPAVPTVTPATPTATPATPTPTPATPTPTPAPATPTPEAPTATPAPPSNTPYVPYRPHVPATTTAPAASTAPGGNMLKNPDFANNGENWSNYIATDQGAAGEVTYGAGKVIFNISKVGTEDWNVQLKQEGIAIEKGATYKLKLKAASTVGRQIKVALMGLDDPEIYTWYGGADLVLTENVPYEVDCDITIDKPIASKVLLQVSMGKITNKETPASTITLSDFSLVKVSGGSEGGQPEPPEPTASYIPVPGNMLKEPDFAEGGNNWETSGTPDKAVVSFEGNKAVYKISNVGTNDYDIQLKQAGLNIEKGATYTLKLKAKSTAARKINVGLQGGASREYDLYGGDGNIELQADTEKDIILEIQMNKETDTDAILFVSMGKIMNEETPTSTITLSDFSLVKVSGGSEGGEPEPGITPGNNLIANGNFADNSTTDFSFSGNGQQASWSIVNGKAVITIQNSGADVWDIQLNQSGVKLEKGKRYQLTFKASSTVEKNIQFGIQKGADYTNYGGTGKTLSANEDTTCKLEFVMQSDTDENGMFFINMGGGSGNYTITIDDIVLKEITVNPSPAQTELLKYSKGDWTCGFLESGAGTFEYSESEKKAAVNITNIGNQDWNVQLKQGGIFLENGCQYTLSMKATANCNRVIKVAMMNADYDWYGGDDITLTADTEETISIIIDLTNKPALLSSSDITLSVSMGKIDDNTPSNGNIQLYDFSLKKIS